MVAYRYQVVSVGRWRGKIKRWNTTFYNSVSSATFTIKNIMQQACWPNPGDVTGACSGGVASISVYDPAGGPPINVVQYFDWQDPLTWIPYTGTAWTGVDPGTPLDASGESALLVVGAMPSLSASGKPVTTRKYIHAIPSRTAAAYTDPDVSSASQTTLKALFPTSWMGNAAGVTPGHVSVEPWYFNHQRVRGRRRSTKQVAAQSFSSGVVVGTGVPASGGGSFQRVD